MSTQTEHQASLGNSRPKAGSSPTRFRLAGRVGILAVLASLATSGCLAAHEKCDPKAVAAFESLPSFDAVEVELHGEPGIGCTDTVQPTDPDAFVTHYVKAMRRAGWTVTPDTGVLATGPNGRVRIDRLEGNDVGVYLVAPGN